MNKQSDKSNLLCSAMCGQAVTCQSTSSRGKWAGESERSAVIGQKGEVGRAAWRCSGLTEYLGSWIAESTLGCLCLVRGGRVRYWLQPQGVKNRNMVEWSYWIWSDGKIAKARDKMREWCQREMCMNTFFPPFLKRSKPFHSSPCVAHFIIFLTLNFNNHVKGKDEGMWKILPFMFPVSEKAI